MPADDPRKAFILGGWHEIMDDIFGTVMEFDPMRAIRQLNHERFGWPVDMPYRGPVVRFIEGDGKIYPVIRIASGQEICGPELEEADPLDAGCGVA